MERTDGPSPDAHFYDAVVAKCVAFNDDRLACEVLEMGETAARKGNPAAQPSLASYDNVLGALGKKQSQG
eukprot:CAMPEP_0183304022 /NCGR_PEP_ID=MMETSP0160_2-20130417/9260_1 /TAXON_ID=2839 ORGANISM="Odontella Sinensis, Strain Grunow 1884" /NCGR_SAMPLE_ID=MMETSP0160_2 /ASSEMBLY_ACC=CAM_ASM_000250 /LENGTH=69 /DNA_ID=CAMNT_0025467009 /DNA_START=63 /DNA_END=269 /DNA_ORIENTATION=+